MQKVANVRKSAIFMFLFSANLKNAWTALFFRIKKKTLLKWACSYSSVHLFSKQWLSAHHDTTEQPVLNNPGLYNRPVKR